MKTSQDAEFHAFFFIKKNAGLVFYCSQNHILLFSDICKNLVLSF